MIKGIVEQTSVQIDVQDDGTILVASADETSMQRAIQLIEEVTVEAQVGKIYKAIVKKICPAVAVKPIPSSIHSVSPSKDDHGPSRCGNKNSEAIQNTSDTPEKWATTARAS